MEAAIALSSAIVRGSIGLGVEYGCCDRFDVYCWTGDHRMRSMPSQRDKLSSELDRMLVNLKVKQGYVKIS
jgi:hypothetical protein